MRDRLWMTALAALAAGLAGCGERETTPSAEPAGAVAPSSRTLTEVIAAREDLAGFRGAAENAGLAEALEGIGPYTVFAPPDAAFGQGAAEWSDAALRAQGAALLRAHIVPGALTRRDIEAAIDAADDGRVEMRTMGEGVLTFSRDGQDLVVTAPDGARARLGGEETVAANGVLQPVDGLLLRLEEPAG